MILLASGAGLLVVGTLIKMQHWPFAGVLLWASYGLLAVGGFLFILAVIKHKRLTGALDPDARTKDPD